jgi:hypothetical protein
MNCSWECWVGRHAISLCVSADCRFAILCTARLRHGINTRKREKPMTEALTAMDAQIQLLEKGGTTTDIKVDTVQAVEEALTMNE